MALNKNRDLLMQLNELFGAGSDLQKSLEIYRKFHCGEKGSEIQAEDFMVFSSVAEKICELAELLKSQPELQIDQLWDHYERLRADRAK